MINDSLNFGNDVRIFDWWGTVTSDLRAVVYTVDSDLTFQAKVVCFEWIPFKPAAINYPGWWRGLKKICMHVVARYTQTYVYMHDVENYKDNSERTSRKAETHTTVCKQSLQQTKCLSSNRNWNKL